MKISDIISKTNCTLLTAHHQINREITGGYVCDLLSWIMAHGKSGQAWITIQTHMNVIAVAALLDLSCIIIPEGIHIDESVLKKAAEEEIPVLISDKSAYELCGIMYEMGVKEGMKKDEGGC